VAVPGGPVDWMRRRRVETGRARRPAGPWTWDHGWDRRGASVSPAGRMVRDFERALDAWPVLFAALTVLFMIFVLARWTAGGGTWAGRFAGSFHAPIYGGPEAARGPDPPLPLTTRPVRPRCLRPWPRSIALVASAPFVVWGLGSLATALLGGSHTAFALALL